MAPRFLNAYLDWYPAGVFRARLNDRPRSDGYPHAHIKRVAGARSIPDADEMESDTPAGRLGEDPYPRTTRGKSYTCELRLRATSEGSLVEYADALSAIFADVSSTGLLVATPWPGHGTDIWATFARIQDYDDDEQLVYDPRSLAWPDTEWMHDPILVVRSLDGRWVHFNESGAWPDDPATPMSWVSNPGSAVIVTNTGNAPAEPVVTVYDVAAGTDVHIGRTAVGVYPEQQLWFRDPVAVAGIAGPGDLVVNFGARPRTVTLNGIDVTASYDAAASDWWDEYVPGMPPGTFNVWRGPGAGVGIEVHFYSASW